MYQTIEHRNIVILFLSNLYNYYKCNDGNNSNVHEIFNRLIKNVVIITNYITAININWYIMYGILK